MRRFLEQYSESISCVVFVLEPCDLGIYEVLLPLYFPRSIAEQENACLQLPADVGGMDGEPLFPDRQIRIIDNPQHALHGTILFSNCWAQYLKAEIIKLNFFVFQEKLIFQSQKWGIPCQMCHYLRKIL